MPEITICKPDLLWYLGSVYSCLLPNVNIFQYTNIHDFIDEMDGPKKHDFQESLKNCLNGSESNENLKKLTEGYEGLGISFIKSIRLVSNDGSEKILDKSFMKRIVHEKHGICYTFQEKYWKRYYYSWLCFPLYCYQSN